MPESEIRLFLADVDGTLVTQEKVLTQRAIDAVHALHAAGVLFAVTSGRPPRGMSMLIEPLELSTPIAAFNGGLIVEPDMKVIEQKLVDAEAKRAKIKELIAQGKSLDEIKAAVGDAPAPQARFASYTEVVYKELAKK